MIAGFVSPLFPINILQNDDAFLLLPRADSKPDTEPITVSGSNGTAIDFDLRNAGSHSIKLATRPTDPIPEKLKFISPAKRENEDDDEEDDGEKDTAARELHEQGRS
uniref:Uncharacterized protein n=1 Tax=Noccaea caerulescens TaxID=107243 RepID=A0A1J3CLS7_NOCCA